MCLDANRPDANCKRWNASRILAFTEAGKGSFREFNAFAKLLQTFGTGDHVEYVLGSTRAAALLARSRFLNKSEAGSSCAESKGVKVEHVGQAAFSRSSLGRRIICFSNVTPRSPRSQLSRARACCLRDTPR